MCGFQCTPCIYIIQSTGHNVNRTFKSVCTLYKRHLSQVMKTVPSATQHTHHQNTKQAAEFSAPDISPVEPAPVEDLLPLSVVDANQTGFRQPEEVIGEEEERLSDPADCQCDAVHRVREVQSAGRASQHLHALTHPQHWKTEGGGGGVRVGDNRATDRNFTGRPQ